MGPPDSPSERIAKQVKEALAPDSRPRRRLKGSAVRNAVRRSILGTRSVGTGVGNFAREAVEGAIQAVGEIGGEAKDFVGDAVIGVVEGTAEFVKVTRPAIKGVVVGAIRGASGGPADVGEVGRVAVGGAIVGAASVGVDEMEVASAAVEGAVEAVVEAGGDLKEVAKATVGGIVLGVAATGGNVAAATRDTTRTLITHAAKADQDITEMSDVAERVVDAVLQEAQETDIKTDEVIMAAATGAVEAAYEVGQSHGDSVRRSVLRRLLDPRIAVAPEMARQLSEVAERLSVELPRGRAAWRVAAMIRAVRFLLHAGGIDLAASMAYFTILSFLPLVALVIMVAALFSDTEGVGAKLTETLLYYFPASENLIRMAVDNLLNGSLAFGIVALVGLVMGANGLFLAATRAVNRIFALESRRAVQITIVQVVVTTSVAVLFLLSLGLTALLQVAIGLSEGIVEATGGVSTVAVVVLGIAATVLPAILTALIFAVAYYRLPNVKVEWRDAAFGAMVAIVMFEVGKHLFFLFTNLTSQRNAVYGPAASVVILLMWGYIAGLIFLYGAALTRAAGGLRPATLSDPRR